VLRWIALAVALRVVLGAAAGVTRGEAAFLQQDSHTYLALAESMVVESAFASATGELEVFRTPGYPFLISLGASFGAALAVTLAIQLALTVLLMSLVFAIVERATGSSATGRLAAAAVGLEPTLLLWSIQIMPETLLAATLLAFIWSAQRFFEQPSAGWVAAAAFSLLAAAYVKPIAYPLAGLLMIVAGVWSFLLRSQPGFRVPAWVFVAICATGLGAWHVRNGVGAGYWGFSTQIDHALYLSGAGAVRARLEGERYIDVRQRMLAAAADLPATAEPDRLSRFQMMRRIGWRTFWSEPLTFASVHVAGMVRTLLDPGAVEYFRLFGAYPDNGGLLGRAVDRGVLHAAWELATHRPALWWSTVALSIVTWPYVMFAAWPGGHTQARVQPAGFLAAVCAVYLLIAGGGVPGSSRFRAPAVPLLVLSAVLARPRVGHAPLPSPVPDR